MAWTHIINHYLYKSDEQGQYPEPLGTPPYKVREETKHMAWTHIINNIYLNQLNKDRPRKTTKSNRFNTYLLYITHWPSLCKLRGPLHQMCDQHAAPMRRRPTYIHPSCRGNRLHKIIDFFPDIHAVAIFVHVQEGLVSQLLVRTHHDFPIPLSEEQFDAVIFSDSTSLLWHPVFMP